VAIGPARACARLTVWWRNVVGIRFVGRLRSMLGALSGAPRLLDRGGRDAHDPPQGAHHPGRARRDRTIARANRDLGPALWRLDRDHPQVAQARGSRLPGPLEPPAQAALEGK